MRWWIALWVSLWMFVGGNAHAQNLIERPGAHPHYVAELEPHLTVESRMFGSVGIGMRASFVVVDNGFISKLNNSIAVGVGLDLGYLDGCYYRRNYCYRNEFDFILPVVMQWNFWFSKEWSAFGEPGLAIGNAHYGNPLEPVLAVGGRYLFNNQFGLTLRLGYPVTTFGVSFLL